MLKTFPMIPSILEGVFINMEIVNGKSPIWVETKNVSPFGYIKKVIDDSDDFSAIELEITKHEGAIVKVVHTVKYKVKSEKRFDTKN